MTMPDIDLDEFEARSTAETVKRTLDLAGSAGQVLGALGAVGWAVMTVLAWNAAKTLGGSARALAALDPLPVLMGAVLVFLAGSAARYAVTRHVPTDIAEGAERYIRVNVPHPPKSITVEPIGYEE